MRRFSVRARPGSRRTAWCPARYSAPHEGHQRLGSSTGGSVRGRVGTMTGMPADSTTGKRFHVETLGCPKNAVDSDKVVASLLADGLVAPPIRRRRRPRRGQHVRVHRGRAPGVDRRRARAGRRAKRRAPGSSSPAAWPSATATSSRPRCPRPTRSSGSRARARSSTSCSRGRKPVGRARPARAAAARAERAVGVREGRRGLRPRVRVLRDPVVPRQAALAHAGVDRGRGARRSSSRASPRSCSSRRTSRGTAATPASPVRSRRCCAGSTRCARTACARVRLLYLYPSEVKDPLVSTMLELPTVVPYFDLSLQHAAPGLLRAHEAVGERRPLRRDHRRHPRARSPTPRSARRSSSGFPGETEADHDDAARVPRRRAARLGRVLRVLARGRHRGRDAWTARSPTSLVRERLRECAEVQEPITAAARARAGRARGRGARRRGRRRRRARRPHAPRSARDRRRRPARRPTASVFARPGAIVRGDGHAASKAPTSTRSRRVVTGGRGADRRAARDEALRAERARDAGELRHAQPHPRRDPDARADPAPTARRGSRSALWFAITATDSLDGWLARRDGATRSGAFLDPVADKLIVLGGLAVLADRGVFPWWPVRAHRRARVRHLARTARSPAGAGVVLPAQRLGKYKAFTQYCAVGFVLLAVTADCVGLQQARARHRGRAHGRVRARDRAARLHRLADASSRE